jgi:hypothetical protein
MYKKYVQLRFERCKHPREGIRGNAKQQHKT